MPRVVVSWDDRRDGGKRRVGVLSRAMGRHERAVFVDRKAYVLCSGLHLPCGCVSRSENRKSEAAVPAVLYTDSQTVLCFYSCWQQQPCAPSLC